MDLGIIVAGCGVGITVDRGVLDYVRQGKQERGKENDLLVAVEEAVGVYDHESCGPV